MTASITPSLLSGQYYQLGDASAGSGSGTLQGLAQALAQTDAQTASSSPASAYLLDLSPTAQNYLTTGSFTGSTGNSGSSFILTPQQQQQVNNILEKYKDAPFTQDTYNQIQNDLKSAGLSPDQLALQNQTRQFNPTQTLLDALNGTDTSSSLTSPTPGLAGEQSNADAYMQKIYSQWQSISTTAASNDGGPTSVSA